MPRFALTLAIAGFLNVSLAFADPPGSTSSGTVSNNQALAERVARHLQTCGTLRDYNVQVLAYNGQVILRGDVRSQEQMREAIRQARLVPGVVQVINELSISGSPADSVQLAQYNTPPALLSSQNGPGATSESGPPTPPPEPLPSYHIPVPAHGMLGSPPLPPIAWPTYAPYNNYSRVAYPTCYPYEAFPYFGPFYPFPKVPLGWRAVKLEWNDGFWFLSTHSQRYDYWVLRFW